VDKEKEMDKENTVYIKRCGEYDRESIAGIVKEGMAALGFAPRGNVFVKPNVVAAHPPEIWPTRAFTEPALVGASLLALAEGGEVSRVDLGENCAIGFPTRYSYRYAGYFEEIKTVKRKARRPVDIFCIDEEKRDRVFIGGAVHDVLRVSRRMARADTKVYLPKLKCHCVSNMTGTVKLNVGICSDDERSIRHDFLLDDKIVDLLSVGYPDFTVMDAVEVGVGNEGFPIPRRLGLILMGRNPVAVDMAGARLLGYGLEDVPYLKRAVERGYGPGSIEEVSIEGDLESLAQLDEEAEKVMPYDEDFYQWQDVHKDLARLGSPLRFYWGPYRSGGNERCLTGCVMGLKMFLASFEHYAGPEVFKTAKPAVMVIGNVEEEIDVKGQDAFLFGSCARARLRNARKVMKIDKCFTTVADMSMQCGARMGMPTPLRDRRFLLPMVKGMIGASGRKLIKGRYLQDIGHFMAKSFERRV